ncbi:DNA-binding response regulator [Noviherbaspirillum cavernae]|uniref:DNA-binding response regulator n=1 Tax=Noviherbaspirillum cavernae TaxID=2320862 RepID=A0A418WYG5_9BURK|nr:response regulator transcription factor [Noviherbaspirillum cavernae]RJG05294.1 DNA-binding response regulator [Noviherbaspirillum cavernae]
MQNLILLEDEIVLRQELAEFLTDTGYQVDAAASLAEFQRIYDPAVHRIAVIDLTLPDGDGMVLIRQLRQQGHKLGIVVLTARRTTPDKIAGLDEGADYYLTKTADLDELAATLTALRRRLGEPEATGRWVLEMAPRRLQPPGFQAIALSQQDVTVLSTLMAEPGKIISRQEIVHALGEDFMVYDQRRLDTQMRRLRRKAEQATGLALPVNTARNAGYRFYAEAEIRD